MLVWRSMLSSFMGCLFRLGFLFNFANSKRLNLPGNNLCICKSGMMFLQYISIKNNAGGTVVNINVWIVWPAVVRSLSYEILIWNMKHIKFDIIVVCISSDFLYEAKFNEALLYLLVDFYHFSAIQSSLYCWSTIRTMLRMYVNNRLGTTRSIDIIELKPDLVCYIYIVSMIYGRCQH